MDAKFATLRRAKHLRHAIAATALAVIAAAIASSAFASVAAGGPATGAETTALTPAAVAATATIAGIAGDSGIAQANVATAAPSVEPALGRQPDPGAAVGPFQARVQPVAAAPIRAAASPNTASYGTQSYTTIDDAVYTAPVNCGDHTCQIALDVYVPTGPGPHPTVVLLRGGPSSFGGRLGLGYFASQLASAGMLVYNADYRDTASDGGGYPMAFQDVACAIRYARATSSALGGDEAVTLVGHSLGGWVGSVVALDATEFQGGCLYGGSGRPDAFVGLAGNYDLQGNEGDLYRFFGADAGASAAAYDASNPFKYATRSPIPVRLVAGTADTTVDPTDAVELNAFLLGRGWNVGLTLVPDGTHMSLVEMSADGTTSLGAIYDAVEEANDAADEINVLKANQAQ
jgi:pimeloyl-ACP methyl ester carboxylesterase